MSDSAPSVAANGPHLTWVPMPVQDSSIPVPPVPPTRRVSAELEPQWRFAAGVVGVGTLIYACVLAWHDGAEGVATAAAFAVAFFALIFGLAGVVPASVKVGDVEVKIQQAKQEGREEGKEEGKEEGALTGFMAGAKVATDVKEQRLRVDDVKEAVKAALMSDDPLRLSDIDVRIPKLASEEDVDALTAEIVDVLQ
jgi:hypothetical protein